MFTFSSPFSLAKVGRAERRKCLKLMEYIIFLLLGRHQSSGAKLTDEDGSAKLRFAVRISAVSLSPEGPPGKAGQSPGEAKGPWEAQLML